jgi:CheY-like chemotaxis protein
MNPRVLLVEPNPLLARMLQAQLSALGCQVSHASSVREAATWLESRRPVLMLVDDDLPDGNGWDVAAAARRIHAPVHGREAKHPPLTTVALRAVNTDARDAQRRPSARQAHDSALRVFALPKPVDMQALQRLLQQCLIAAQSPPTVDPTADLLQDLGDSDEGSLTRVKTLRHPAAWDGTNDSDDDDSVAVLPPRTTPSRDDADVVPLPWWQR